MDHLAYPEQHANVAKLTSEMEEEADLCPFPTLIDALHKVDPDVGFNIEVKYPMMQEVSHLSSLISSFTYLTFIPYLIPSFSLGWSS